MTRLVPLCGLLLLIGLPLVLPQSERARDQHRGKEIYFKGVSPSGSSLTAQFGNPPNLIDGALMACVNCHGNDGRGRREGGVTATDITWQALTKPYGVTHDGGRAHPAYTERLLLRAITMGIDPAGNKLHVAMPRFQLSREDANDLIAYLKRLGDHMDPGLGDSTIKLGTLIPADGPPAERGRAAVAIMSAYFDEVNRLGGIYNRKIDLHIAETGQTTRDRKIMVEKLIEDERVFALVGAFMAGADEEIASLCEESRVPSIGPSTLFPDSKVPPRRYTFYLLSGVREQGEALVRFAVRSTKSQHPRVAVLNNGEFTKGVAELIEKKCRELGSNDVASLKYSTGLARMLVRQLSHRRINTVFFLGSGRDLADFAAEAARHAWEPDLFLIGPLVGGGQVKIPAVFKGRVFMSFPNSPSDYTQEGLNEFRKLGAGHDLVKGYTTTQVSGYAAAKILVAALRLVGRDLSRDKLVAALEGIYDFETGLTRPISFGPNRRIGALGAYVVAFDVERAAFSLKAEWVSLE